MPIYYISDTDGNDSRTVIQAQSQATPWKSIARLNSAGVVIPGDTILFKAGDTFAGALTMTSGTDAKRVVYSRYGTGPNPVLTGFTTLSGWVADPTRPNVYYTSYDVTQLNAVSVDGVMKAYGRFPKTGYLNYESHAGNSSITDNQLSGTPSFVGGEVVIRKLRWQLDRHRITGHSGGTLTYSADNFWGNNQAAPVTGNGYFIQNHIATLTQDLEWCYDRVAKRIYMYFAGAPGSRVVKAATREFVVIMNGQSYINFAAVDFEGGNYAIYHDNGTNNVNFINCNFRNHGANALYAMNSNNVVFDGGSISDCLNTSLQIEGCNFYTVKGMAINNSGIIAGMGQGGDGSHQGIRATSNNITIQNNRITNSGYTGIYFIGDNILVEKNYIDTHGFVKDDSGGIYTYNVAIENIYTNRIIRNNIVLNAIGAHAGTEGDLNFENYGKACGIYLDDFSNGTKVYDNYVERSDWAGIFMHNCFSNELLNNTVYDTANALFFVQEETATRGNNIASNQFIAKTATQKTLTIQMQVADNPALFGTFNYNIYARPVAEGATIAIDRRYSSGMSFIDLQTWKNTYARDLNSTASQVSISSEDQIESFYNAADANLNVNLENIYKDVAGAVYSSEMLLQPYKGTVLTYYEEPAPVVPKETKVLMSGGIILMSEGKILTTLA